MSEPEPENKDCPDDSEQPEQPKKKTRKPRGLPKNIQSVAIPAEMITVIDADAERQTELATMTPNALVRLAVERDLDIDRLEKLLELQMRWEHENARKAFFAALSKFQSELPPILKIDKVDAAKAGKRKFASLGTINEAIRPYLYGNGLSFRFRQHQSPEGISVTCIVSHRDGHSEETSLIAAADTSGGKNAIQSIGSTVTYLERYTLVSALGLTTVDDDDDGGETGVSRESALEMARQAAASGGAPVQSQQPTTPPATEPATPTEPPKSEPTTAPAPQPMASASQIDECLVLMKELFASGSEAQVWLMQQDEENNLTRTTQPSQLTTTQIDGVISLLLKMKADKQLAQLSTPAPAPTTAPVSAPVEPEQQQSSSDGMVIPTQRKRIRELMTKLYGDNTEREQSIWLQSLGLGSAMALTYQQAADRIMSLEEGTVIPF